MINSLTLQLLQNRLAETRSQLLMSPVRWQDLYNQITARSQPYWQNGINSMAVGAGGTGYTSGDTWTSITPVNGAPASGTLTISGGIITAAAVSIYGSGFGANTFFLPTININTSTGTGGALVPTLANTDQAYNIYPTDYTTLVAAVTDANNLALLIQALAYVPSGGVPTAGAGYNFLQNLTKVITP